MEVSLEMFLVIAIHKSDNHKESEIYRIVDFNRISDGYIDIEYRKIFKAFKELRKNDLTISIDHKVEQITDNPKEADIIKRIILGEEILGLKVQTSLSMTDDHVIIKTVIQKSNNTYDIKKSPLIDEHGNPISQQEAEKLIVIGWSGFGKNKKFHFINYKGEQYELSAEQVRERINDVNGIYLVRDDVRLYCDLNREIKEQPL